MGAIKQAKIYSRPRTPLETVVPLETPFSVEIDVSSFCNFRCNFCFHKDRTEIRKAGVKFGMMEMELFRKIVNDLGDFPEKIKKIRLFEFGEPLLNRHLPEMIRHIWQREVAEYVEITTNGTLLTKELNVRLIESGLSRINISVNALTAKKYKEVANCAVDMRRFVSTLKHLYQHKKDCHIYIKLADDGSLTSREEEKFYATFGDLCDEIFVEKLSPIWRDTEINSELSNAIGPYGQRLEYKLVCPLIFTRMVINYDGVVVACCVDWKRRYVLGNAATDSVYDIWNGERLEALQMVHLKGERESVPLCQGCSALTSCTIDNIDAHADELLGKFEKKRGQAR